MLENLKLRDRLLIGYAVPVVLFLGLAWLTYLTSNKVFDTFQEIERVEDVIVGVNKTTLNCERMIGSFRGYLAVRNEVFIEEYNTASKLFDEAIEAVNESIVREDQKSRLDRMMEVKNNFDRFAQQVIQLVEVGNQEEAIARFNTGSGKDFVEGFERLSNEFSQAEQTLLKEETQETKNNLSALLGLLVLGSIALIILSVIVAFNLALRVSGTIDKVVRKIAGSSTEISATIEDQERTASQQAASVNQTTTTMDELSASSQASAEQAEAAAAAARQALTLAEGGTKAVNNTLEGMASLNEKVGAIAQQIIRLSEQTNQIGNISALVSDLASQTNMLALNAAVEAVRAGEHGKGFAVVASEIRKLADESRRSAERINALVADIQTAFNSTVMATEEGTKTVQSGVEIARETADAFSGVAESVNNVVVNNQQISLNVKQQAIAVKQVVDAMNSLNIAARETASGLTQTKVGIQKLNEAALELKSVI
ncbi:MAG: methyl-accepting chemotaxis protein [Cyanobacteriota bacterium]|nr:methyl-accepting chemotaxis protein [Cyanobacteriota bacterium]